MVTALNQSCPPCRSTSEFRRNSHFFLGRSGFLNERRGFTTTTGGRVARHDALLVVRPYRAKEPGMRGSFSACLLDNLHACIAPIERREVLALVILASFQPLQQTNAAKAADENLAARLTLESYIDDKEGFTLLKPLQWKKIEKAGATVLFEDPQSKGNNVGVVVNPVRISSLTEFGTVDAVATRLLQAEKRKPSTNDVQLIKVNERQIHGGVPLYQLEYKLDSSRGIKRILSAVTVASKKLYILNVAYADSLEKPLQSDMAMTLEQIVNSFDVL